MARVAIDHDIDSRIAFGHVFFGREVDIGNDRFEHDDAWRIDNAICFARAILLGRFWNGLDGVNAAHRRPETPFLTTVVVLAT